MPLFRKTALALAALAAVTFSGAPLAPAAPDGHQALKLMGKPAGTITGQVLSIKPRPAADGYRRTFDQRDYYDKTSVVKKNHGADVFVDMNRQMAEDSESWRGTAGMQINW